MSTTVTAKPGEVVEATIVVQPTQMYTVTIGANGGTGETSILVLDDVPCPHLRQGLETRTFLGWERRCVDCGATTHFVSLP